MKRTDLTLFAIVVLVSTASGYGQFMLGMGEHLMDVIERPFIRTENIIVDARVFEYVDEQPQNADLQKLEQMVNQDDQRFLETIRPSIDNQQQQQQQPQQNHQERHENENLNQHDQKSHQNYVFHDANGKYANFDDSYILVEFEHNVNEEQVKDFFNYLSSVSFAPVEAFQDLSINNNVILFRVDKDSCEPNFMINTILKHQLKIQHDKQMHILNCELAIKSQKLRIVKNLDKSHWSTINTNNNQSSSPSSSTSTLVLLILIMAPILLATLLGILICMVQRRRMLMMRSHNEDEERLINKAEMLTNGEETSKWRRMKSSMKSAGDAAGAAFLHPASWTKFVKRSPPSSAEKPRSKDGAGAEDYHDLCRQRMESNTEKCSPISSTMCTNLSNMNTPGLSGINSSTINSTPIRITNEGKASSDAERNSS